MREPIDLRIISISVVTDFQTNKSSCLSLWIFDLRITISHSRLSESVYFENQSNLSFKENSYSKCHF